MNKIKQQIDKIIGTKGAFYAPAYYLNKLITNIVDYFDKKITNLNTTINNFKQSINNQLKDLNTNIDFNTILNQYTNTEYSIFGVKGFPRVGEFTISIDTKHSIIIYSHNFQKIIYTNRQYLTNNEHNIKLNNDGHDLEMIILYYDYGYDNTETMSTIIDKLPFKEDITEIITYQKVDFKNMYNDSIKNLQSIKSFCKSNVINSFNIDNFKSDYYNLSIDGEYNLIDGSFNKSKYYVPTNIKVNNIINSFNNTDTSFCEVDGIVVSDAFNVLTESNNGEIAIIKEGIRKLSEKSLRKVNNIKYYVLPNSLEILNQYACCDGVKILLHDGNKNLKIEPAGYKSDLKNNVYVGDTNIIETFSTIENKSNMISSDEYNNKRSFKFKVLDMEDNTITKFNINKLINNHLFNVNDGNPTHNGVLFIIDNSYFSIETRAYKNYYISNKIKKLFICDIGWSDIIIDSMVNPIVKIGTSILNSCKIIVPTGATGYNEEELINKGFTLNYVDNIEQYVKDNYE